MAIRHEDSDDYGDATVGKFAIGWQPIDQVKIRYSTSETFRAPAMILVNEGFLGRSSSTEDALLTYAAGGVNQDNYKEHLIDVSKIFWSYPKQLIEESSKADIVFSY